MSTKAGSAVSLSFSWKTIYALLSKPLLTDWSRTRPRLYRQHCVENWEETLQNAGRTPGQSFRATFWSTFKGRGGELTWWNTLRSSRPLWFVSNSVSGPSDSAKSLWLIATLARALQCESNVRSVKNGVLMPWFAIWIGEERQDCACRGPSDGDTCTSASLWRSCVAQKSTGKDRRCSWRVCSRRETKLIYFRAQTEECTRSYWRKMPRLPDWTRSLATAQLTKTSESWLTIWHRRYADWRSKSTFYTSACRCKLRMRSMDTFDHKVKLTSYIFRKLK